jgi:PKD domain
MHSSIKNILIGIIILIISQSACKKNTIPTGDDGVVEFLFDGKINNVPKQFAAGKKNYFMHTTFYKDIDQILNFEGQFGIASKKDSNEYLKIIFKNYTGSNNPAIDSLFGLTDYYSISTDTATSLVVNGKAVQFSFGGITQNITNYLWSFGDGQTSTQANPYHVYTISGKVNVSCLVFYSTSQQDFLSNELDVSNGTNCKAQFTITNSGINNLTCTASGGSGNYTWQLPNGSTQSGSSIVYNDSIVFRDYITLKDNGACQNNYKQVVAPSNSVALVNYNYTAKDTSYTQPIVANANYGKVIVEYFDGVNKYVSFKNDANLKQSDRKILKLTNKNLYQKNSAGMRTVKLVGELGTYLYNTTNNADSIFVSSNRLQLAVAFP